MASERVWDIVVLGATGYTGRCAVEHIYTHTPTNLRWAVAGRSANKLGEIVSRMQATYPDRTHPAVEVVNLSKDELDALAKKTKVIINGVGPYHIFSTPVVEACANNGTHYVDVTGETPWVADLVRDFHDTAKASGAIIVPSVALESLPTDIISYVLASHFRKKYNADTEHVTTCCYKIKSGGFSGGTLSTILTIFDAYPLKTLQKILSNPYSLSPTPPAPLPSTRRPFLSRLFGPHNFPPLGLLTTSPTSTTNSIYSLRTSSFFLPSVYGPQTLIEEYARVPNRLIGLLMHIGLALGPLFLIIPPIRHLLQKLVTQPGFGPSEKSNHNSYLDWRGLGVASAANDSSSSSSEKKEFKALAKFTYNRDVYYMSGALMVECAMSMLGHAEQIQKRFQGGGIMTAGCLAEAGELIELLRRDGWGVEVEDV